MFVNESNRFKWKFDWTNISDRYIHTFWTQIFWLLKIEWQNKKFIKVYNIICYRLTLNLLTVLYWAFLADKIVSGPQIVEGWKKLQRQMMWCTYQGRDSIILIKIRLSGWGESMCIIVNLVSREPLYDLDFIHSLR